MRICKIDKMDKLWGRGGPAGFSWGNAGAAAAGAAGSAAGSATPGSSAGSAVVGGAAGMAAGRFGGPIVAAGVGAYVTSEMDTYNSNNPAGPTFGITVTDNACLNRSETNRTPTDPAGNPQGGSTVQGPGDDEGGYANGGDHYSAGTGAYSNSVSNSVG